MNVARLSVSVAFIAVVTAACSDAPTTVVHATTDPNVTHLATECQTRCPLPALAHATPAEFCLGGVDEGAVALIPSSPATVPPGLPSLAPRTPLRACR